MWQLHPVWDDGDRRRAARTAGPRAQTDEARERRGAPADAVVIGSDGSGDLLVLPAGADEPSVWDHETGDLRPVPTDWT